MRHLSFGLVVLATAASASAQQPKVPDNVAPQPVTLTGCVTAGEKDGSFLLTHVVANAPVGTSGSDAVAPPFYWLDSAKKLKSYVGHKVEVVGTLTGDVDKTKIKHKDGEMKVERERVKDVKEPEGTSAAANTPSGERAGYKVKVKSVKMLEGGCS
jgi:hypothetical protein